MAEDCRIPSLDGTEEKFPLSIDKQTEIERNALVESNVLSPHSSLHNKYSVTRTKVAVFHLNLKSQTSLLNSRTLLTLFVLVLCSNFLSVCSLSLDCDSVQKCICGRDDDSNGWRIDCPNEILVQYPIQLKVRKLDYGIGSSNDYKTASLSVTCDAVDTKTDPWSYIKGMDLSEEQVYAKIVSLEIKRCPTVKDGWSELFQKLNLNGSDMERFSYVTEDTFDEPVFIPPSFFNNMPNIKVLNLRHNKLTSVPDLSSLKNLTSINFRNNNVELVPVGTFTENTQLTSITFGSNKIYSINPGTFPESTEHLELYSNDISQLNASAFSNLKHLKRLILNNNPLDNLDSKTFDGLESLEELLIYNTRMTQFPNFSNLPKLTNLTISNQILSRTLSGPDGAEITTTLAPNYLPENTLILENLPSLENLDLPLNHFTSLPTLRNLSKLVKLNLARNELTEIESGTFNLPSLKILILSRNRIIKLGAIKAFSLVELDLARNNLTELRNDTFRFVNSLKKLNLSRNQIGGIPYKIFEPLVSLEDLDLSYNQVTFSASPYDGFSGADYFGDISNYSPLRYLIKMRRLNLAHNNIPKLGYSDWAQVYTAINEINLSFNKIKQITANELNFISSNLTINLENNEISRVNLDFSFILDANAGDNKQIRVFLSGNPLNCDCYAYNLKTWKSISFELRTKGLNCDGPEELKGQGLLSVPDNLLLCDMTNEQGCPEHCSCRQRRVDRTILVDCSSRNLTTDEIPELNVFSKPFTKWDLELDLSNNLINDFNNTTYIKEYLNKTKIINLRGNNLTSTLFLERIPEYQTTTFSLARNPFPCGKCVEFQIPWRAYPTRINDLGNVTCLKESSTDFAKMLTGGSTHSQELVYVQENSKEFENHCANNSKLTTVVILPLVIAVILLTCICISLFVSIRYGWAIKAYLYSKGLDWCLFWERDLDDDDEAEKIYDAFVSYSHKDEEWVLDELVKRLEDQEGFKLCLHFRDWMPGDWIPDQIVRSVDRSRRTVVVLSKNFVESVWSTLEFKAAHAQALKERSNRVILILLGEELKESDVQDDDLKMYMKMNTFMKWNDPLFWHRLKYALPHRKPCTNNSTTQQTEAELKHNAINKMQQRDRAIKLDKLRAKLEQTV